VTGVSYKFNANALGDLEYSYGSLGWRTLVSVKNEHWAYLIA
jgi:hypothetical protein